MNKTILIIDDDNVLRSALATGLRNNDFQTLTAESAEIASDILARISVDAIVLDRMMTGIDGVTFLKHLRKSGNNTPVIMLTAMSSTDDTIDGLSGGADDYMSKPFQIRELVLRINNITKHLTTTTTITPSGLIFENNDFFANKNNEKQILSLSNEEKKLLQNLISPMGNIAPASPMVAKRLRNKLNIVLSNLDIITIRGRGYKLVDLSTTSDNNRAQE
jgi:two-component system phosphate regulon response regulator OmpR